MKRITFSGLKRIKGARASFTMIELLVVIAIIGILAALTLAAASGAMNMAARSRAHSEIQAMSAGLESYKADNGAYPQSDGTLVTNSYSADSSSSLTTYQTNAVVVFTSLFGTNYFSAQPAPGMKTYMSFKANQVAQPNGPFSYIKDPWGNPYGYSTGNNGVYPYNGSGFFDLWSTGGLTGAKVTQTNTWISNWAQ